MTDRPAASATEEDGPAGFAFAASAYVLWGVFPIYMKALAHVPTVEVIAHRVLWSVPLALAVLALLGRAGDLRAALRSPATLRMAALTATLVSINWGVYVWCIAADRALDAALGYYVNPLFSVLLGAVLLKERLSRLQWTAIGIAAAAILVLLLETGRLPIAALALTASWGFYGFFRKTLPIGPNQGFALEVLLLLPAALAYLLWLGIAGAGSFGAGGRDTLLLLGCGLVTAGPLLLFANGAKRLRLSTIGMMQYITPTLVFLIAALAFGEEIGRGRAIAFPLIWIALAIYTADMLSRRKDC